MIFSSTFADLCRDSREGANRISLSFHLALEDVRDRYRKSLLGLFWITVSFLMFLGIKLLVFGRLNLNANVNFGSFLTIGFGTWVLISAIITEGANSYIQNKTWILSSPLPYTVYILQNCFRNFINWGFIVVGMVPILAVTGVEPSLSLLGLIPALLTYALASIWSTMLLAPISAWSRDFSHLLNTFMRIMFFATPIIWIPKNDSVLSALAKINPFYHYIEIIRTPILYHITPWYSWGVVAAVSVIGTAAGIVSYLWSRNRVPFWL